MILPAILSVLVGAVLGTRFKVFVLVPAILLGWLLVALVGLDAETGRWSAFATMIVVAGCAQLGFVFGFSTRMVLGSMRLARRRVRWPTVSTTSEGSVG